MPTTQPVYTPHGPEADAAVGDLVQRALKALSDRKLLPVESIGHYVVGDYARGEGWAALEGGTWIAYDTPHLLLLLPPGFEEEAAAAKTVIHQQLQELCVQVGYSLRLNVVTEETLKTREQGLLAYEVATSRALLWSYDGHDPLEFLNADSHRIQEHGIVRLVSLEQSLQELAVLSERDIHGLHQGIVRLSFIRAIEILSALGDAILLKEGCFEAPLLARTEALAKLCEQGVVHPQLMGLYRTAVALRIRQPQPRIPAWNDMRELIKEVDVWARHVAHAHFGADVVERPAA